MKKKIEHINESLKIRKTNNNEKKNKGDERDELRSELEFNS